MNGLNLHDEMVSKMDETHLCVPLNDQRFIAKIKEEEREKTIEEMSQTIRKIEEDTSHCLFDCPKADDPITCTICTLERAIKQMKGDKNG